MDRIGKMVNSDSLVYWLASYPRSGNTLARMTLSHALLLEPEQSQLEKNFPSLDVLQSSADRVSKKPLSGYVRAPLTPEMGATFEGTHGRVRFVKTHWCSPDIMDLVPSVGGAYFVRHPLDVFLSGLNYIYWNSPKVDSFRKFFNNKPVSVSDIIRNGELEIYIDRFIDDKGLWPFEFGSGTWCESVKNWSFEAVNRRVTLIQYSTLVDHRAEKLREILSSAGLIVTEDMITRGVQGGEAVTQPDGKFFWRGGEEIRNNHVSSDKVQELQSRLFQEAGLENIPDEFHQ